MNKFLTAEEANAVLDKYTLLEFIRDSEIAFGLDEVDLDQMTTEELNMYILKLDTMYIYLEVQEPMWYLKQS